MSSGMCQNRSILTLEDEKMRQKHDEDFRLVMTQAEKSALEALAEHDDGSQAAIIRRLVRSEAERRGLWPSVQEHATPAQPAVRA